MENKKRTLVQFREIIMNKKINSLKKRMAIISLFNLIFINLLVSSMFFIMFENISLFLKPTKYWIAWIAILVFLIIISIVKILSLWFLISPIKKSNLNPNKKWTTTNYIEEFFLYKKIYRNNYESMRGIISGINDPNETEVISMVKSLFWTYHDKFQNKESWKESWWKPFKKTISFILALSYVISLVWVVLVMASVAFTLYNNHMTNYLTIVLKAISFVAATIISIGTIIHILKFFPALNFIFSFFKDTTITTKNMTNDISIFENELSFLMENKDKLTNLKNSSIGSMYIDKATKLLYHCLVVRIFEVYFRFNIYDVDFEILNIKYHQEIINKKAFKIFEDLNRDDESGLFEQMINEDENLKMIYHKVRELIEWK